MTAPFEPSSDFVARVMGQVRTYEASKAGMLASLLRYLAAGGAIATMLRAAPVF